MIIQPVAACVRIHLFGHKSQDAQRLQIMSERDRGAAVERVMEGIKSGCLLTRSMGVGGTQQGFKIGKTEWPKVNPVTQCDRAGQP